MTVLEQKLSEIKVNLTASQGLLDLEPTWERMRQFQGHLHTAISLSMRVQKLITEPSVNTNQVGKFPT